MTPDERPSAARDRAYMRRALSLARKGWGQTAPNPMVGAVVVRDGEIVGEGYHAAFGEAHAEVAALQDAGERARGATVYVTLEPCAHSGKTPPCTVALLAAGIRRVVAASRDPNPVAAGGGSKLTEAGVVFESGVEEEAARELNADFFHAFASDRPHVTLKLALSLDGAIADARRSRGWLTGAKSRRHVHRLRAGCDAIAVGIGTAIADDPLLTVRGVRAPRVAPVRVVFDRRARLPLDAALVRTAREAPTLIVAEDPEPSQALALRAAGIELLTTTSLADALRELRRRELRSLFVEGGAALAGAFLAGRLVDRLVIFQAPVLLGAGALRPFDCLQPVDLADASRWRLRERRTFGDDLMTIYTPATPCSPA